jgi:hypothetical protein
MPGENPSKQSASRTILTQVAAERRAEKPLPEIKGIALGRSV